MDKKGSEWGFTFVGGSEESGPELTDMGALDENLADDGLSFPLNRAKVGDRLWIVGFKSREAKDRLLGMGFHPETEIEVISKTPGGSVIVAIQTKRIGVGGGMAAKIMVRGDRPC